MKFHVLGKIVWSVGSCHDDRSEEINEMFEIPHNGRKLKEVKAEAIEKAREIIKDRHEKNCHLVDYGLSAQLRIVEPIWSVVFRDEEPAQPAVKARKAKPARLVEKKL